jgi:hypothetical protein
MSVCGRVLRVGLGAPCRRFQTAAKALNNDKTTLSKFDVLGSALPPSTLLMRSVGNHGLTLGNLQVKGPCVVLNNSLFLWDVPQFGVGGPEGFVENNLKGLPSATVVDDPSSPFHGWSTDVFKLFELAGPLPGKHRRGNPV